MLFFDAGLDQSILSRPMQSATPFVGATVPLEAIITKTEGLTGSFFSMVFFEGRLGDNTAKDLASLCGCVKKCEGYNESRSQS